MCCPVHRGIRRILAALFLTAAAAFPAAAQTATVLANFEIGPKRPVGKLVEVQDGIFYGVSRDGGAFSKGSVYILYRKADGSWGTYTLHSFSGADGARPAQGLLLGHDGNFYGTTTEEGPAGTSGTVFRMTPFGVLTTLRAFPIVDATANRPAAPLTQSADGFIWGTTCPSSLGTSQVPTVFRMTTAGGFATIYRSPSNGLCLNSLAHTDDGRLLVAAHQQVFESSTTVFGLTRAGQTTGGGVSFTGAPTIPLFRGSDGIFYGLAGTGYPFNQGTVFGVRGDGTVARSVPVFTGVPETLVEVSPGVLYGTSRHEFFGSDVLFRVDQDAGFSVVQEWPFSFDERISSVIGAPRVSLLRGVGGLLYGVSTDAGTAAAGVVFSLDLLGGAATLSSFSSGPLAVVAPLVESAGGFYGVSCAGGSFSQGTAFRVTPAGDVTTLYSFGGVSGACPTSLVRGPDGGWYGNTFTGSIFRMTDGGAVTVLHTLDPLPTGGRFPDAVTIDANGSLWGNWEDSAGSFVYRVTMSGVFTRFAVPPDAGRPGPGLAFDATGNFFGPLHIGGALGGSSQLFRMTPDGAFTPQFRFPNLEFVLGRLRTGSDGLLYGSAAAFHGNHGGYVFRATPDGQVSTVHVFTEQEGYNSFSELVEAPSSELAGAMFGRRTSQPQFNGQYGSVFAVSKTGVLRTLHRFTWLDGANPFGALVLGSDGALYGTTISGGTGGGGVVFRIQP